MWLSEMIIVDLIERNRFTGLTSLVTLTSREITNGVQLLISGGTVTRIDLVPMSFVKSAAGSNVRFDTSQQASYFSFGGAFFAASPKITTFLGVVTANAIQKRMSVSPTMTGFILGHYVKRTTHDNRTVFITTQINQIVANSKRKCHLLSPVWWGAAPLA